MILYTYYTFYITKLEIKTDTFLSFLSLFIFNSIRYYTYYIIQNKCQLPFLIF